MNYETLLKEADSQFLVVKEKPLIANDGRIKGKRIAIRQDVQTDAEKACILAEELGHYHTTVGDILDQSDTSNRKQELHARAWAYQRGLQLSDIVRAFKYGCRNRYEISEYLGVTEAFLQNGIDYYNGKYGSYTKCGNYIIYFDPLGVLEFESFNT